MLKTFFKLKEHKTSVSREIFSGLTTFLAMSYILFVNPAILAHTGMPIGGLFAATVFASFFCTLIMSLYANVPLALAPGMGINTLITYMFCLGLKFHWQEAMALTFITGLLHMFLMQTKIRKNLVSAIPKNLQYATGAGIGMFIAYIGVRKADFIEFITSPGQYIVTPEKMVISSASETVPAMITIFSATQLIAIIGLLTTLYLMSLEKKTGDSYGALLLGIIVATFVGIPLNVTQVSSISFFDFNAIFEIKTIALSFFGSPGLLSLFATPLKATLTLLIMSLLLLTNIIDSISTILGIGQLEEAAVITAKDLNDFEKNDRSKLDKILIANSAGGVLAAVFGTTTATTFCESVTGITAGGRTGLASFVVAVLFILCLPFAGFFGRIPAAAVAPALIIAGFFLLFLVKNINWNDFEEAVPAAFIILFTPITGSILDGVVVGYFAHVVIQTALGNYKKVHPFIYGTLFIFITIVVIRSILKI